jgi:hypothetical protein
VIATPFVQGRLRQAYVSIDVDTTCKHCGQAIQFAIDSDLRVAVRESGAKPLVFMPDIDWDNFAERTIIDAY